MKKLWDKGKDVSNKVGKFLASDLWAEQKLVKHECLASIAHAKMLKKIGILNEIELKRIIGCLKEIIDLDKENQFIITFEDEDVHTKVENYLTDKLGDTGKKIHTYRSRNDQLLVNQRLFNKEKIINLGIEVSKLQKSLLDLAKKHEFTPVSGYTHRQKAMLSSIGLWASSFAESLNDDLNVLLNAYEINDQCPLGSAASYGVPANIDRKLTSDILGFSKVQSNSLYCHNSRGKIESVILNALSQIMLTLSKLSADLILFSTAEFGYITLGDEVSTGSSIMPQKRNPDVPELIKGNACLVLGYENTVKNVINGLTSGYNKETQVVKEASMKALLLTIDSVKMMDLCVSTLTINKKKCEESCTKEIFATDYSYELVEKGVPFREAYKKTANEINNIEIPGLVEAIKRRNHIGGLGNLGLDDLEKDILTNINKFNEKKKEFEALELHDFFVQLDL